MRHAAQSWQEANHARRSEILSAVKLRLRRQCLEELKRFFFFFKNKNINLCWPLEKLFYNALFIMMTNTTAMNNVS